MDIGEYIQVVKLHGLQTDRPAVFGDDVTISGDLQVSGTISNASSTTNVEQMITDTFLPSVAPTLGTGTNQKYRAPTITETREIINSLYLIAREAGKPLSEIDTSNAYDSLSDHGFTLSEGYDAANNKAYVLVESEATYPSSSNFRAWGWYLFGMSQPISLIVSAPHPRTDGNSEFIALRYAQKVPGTLYVLSSVNRKSKDYMLAEIYSEEATSGTFTLTFRGQTTTALDYDSTPAQVQAALEALSTIGAGNVVCTGDEVNTTLHCFANLNPSLYDSNSPTDTITGTSVDLDASLSVEHDADVAHNYNSVFNKAIESFAQQGYAHLQFHGYSDESSGVPRCFSAILSRGSSNNTPLQEAIRTALEAQGFDVGLRDSYDTQGLYFTGLPTGGTFTLTCDGQTTASITYSTVASSLSASIQAALEALSTIGAGNVKVALTQNTNGSTPAFVVTFRGALYHAGKQITLAGNSLSGGIAPTPVMLTANGTALTAQSNSQGDIAEANGTLFLHLELSQTVRESALLSGKVVDAIANTNLPQLSAAAMPVLAEAGHSTSQAPLVNGSGATIGTSSVAARADHRHPATLNTPSTGDIIYRSSASWQAGTPDTAGVVSKSGSQSITGLKSFASLSVSSSPPASSGATGTAGTITWDSEYLYVCIATNTWKRAALSTW